MTVINWAKENWGWKGICGLGGYANGSLILPFFGSVCIYPEAAFRIMFGHWQCFLESWSLVSDDAYLVAFGRTQGLEYAPVKGALHNSLSD
jgi:hypothetical protein